MTNAWTQRSYALFRAALGLYLAVHFAHLLPWAAELFSSQGVLPADTSPLLRAFPNVLRLADAPWAARTLVAAGALLAVALAAGWWDRLAALLLWYVWACLFGRNPLIANPGLPYVGLLLLVHAALPRRARSEEAGSWGVPPALFVTVWVLMALGYSYSGYTKLISPSWVDGSAVAAVLDGPLARPGPLRDVLLALPPLLLRVCTWGTLVLELAFAPLALWRRARPALWAALLGMHVALVVLLDFADLSLGLVMLHLFTFDPAWVPAARQAQRDTVFFDGACGMCHGLVRFVLGEARQPGAFRFAPLHGETFRAVLSAEERAGLPDSVVVRCEDGRLLVRSAAVLHLLSRLGGVWRVVACVGRLVPLRVRDAAYDVLARVRRHSTAAACPLPPPHWRADLAP